MEGTYGEVLTVRLRTCHSIQPLAIPPRSSHPLHTSRELTPKHTLTPPSCPRESHCRQVNSFLSLSTFLSLAFSFCPQALVFSMGLASGNNSMAILLNNSLEATNIKPAVYVNGGRKKRNHGGKKNRLYPKLPQASILND